MENIQSSKEPQSLTTENIRSFKGFENISDKEAEDTVYSIHTLCRIVFEFMMEQENAASHNLLNTAA